MQDSEEYSNLRWGVYINALIHITMVIIGFKIFIIDNKPCEEIIQFFIKFFSMSLILNILLFLTAYKRWK